MKDPRDVILSPVVSEKSYALMDAGTYTFFVSPDSSKPEIADAIEAIFGVTVTKVNTMNRRGKATRVRRANRPGKTSGSKRALVTLKAGDRIEMFEN
jgi:large subunit ribosomal protein L23